MEMMVDSVACRAIFMVHNTLAKGKIIPVHFLTEHHAMKAYWGKGCTPPLIL